MNEKEASPAYYLLFVDAESFVERDDSLFDVINRFPAINAGSFDSHRNYIIYNCVAIQ